MCGWFGLLPPPAPQLTDGRTDWLPTHPCPCPLTVVFAAAVANLRAQGEEAAARELVGRLLFFGAMLGLVLIPVLQTLSYPLLTLLGARSENYVEAVEYFQVSQ